MTRATAAPKSASRSQIEWGLILGLLILIHGFSAKAQPPFFPFGAPQIIAEPPPPWTPGQEVQFSVTIDRFRAVERDGNGNVVETQFLHGLGLDWGNCWTDVRLGEPPPTRYTNEGFNGRWLALPEGGPPSRCKAQRRFPGFYFDGERTLDDRRIPLDDDPANNYGDGLREGPSLQGAWTFRWTARLKPCPPNECNLDFQVLVLPDGETGSWNRLPPGCDAGAQPPLVAASGKLSRMLQVVGNRCLGEPLSIRCSTPHETERVRWTVSEAEILQEDACAIRLRWVSPGRKQVVRTRLDSDGAPSCSDTVWVELTEPPTPDFNLSATRICGNEAIEAWLTPPLRASWRWRSEPPAIQTVSEDLSTARFIWLQGTRAHIVLELFDSTCGRWIVQRKEILVDQPVEYLQLELSSRGICAGESVQVRARTPLDTEVHFSFSGTAFELLRGSGPHQVVYPQHGYQAILATAQRGTCRRLALEFVQVFERFNVAYESPVRLCQPETLYLAPRITPNDFANPTTRLLIESWTPIEGIIPLVGGGLILFPDTTTTYQIHLANGPCKSVSMVQINVVPPLRIEGLVPQSEYCLQGEVVQLRTEVSGGQPPYAYRWYPPDYLSNPYGSATQARPPRSTEYVLEVTDSAGCRQEARTRIIPLEIRILGFERQAFRCGLQSPPPQLRVEVPPGAAYQYQWLPPVGLSCVDCLRPTVIDTANRSYELQITDQATGCRTRVGPIAFEYIQALRAEAGFDARICRGDGVRLGADLQQPFEVTYSWRPTNGLSAPDSPRPIATPDETTTYTLQVAVPGCPTIRDTVRVEVVPRPLFRIEATRTRFCAGDSVRLRIEGPTDLAGLRWRWRPPIDLSSDTAKSPWAFPTSRREYELVIQGIECPPAERVSIELAVDLPPSVEIGSDSLLVCPGQAGTGIELPARNFDGRPTAYRWEPSIGLDQPFSLRPRARPTHPTVYHLTATDVATGCTVRDSVWVGIGPFVQATVSWTDTIICRGDSVAIEAQGGVGSARYHWRPAEFTSCSPCPRPVLKPKQTTTYTLVADEGGCSSTAEVQVKVVPRPLIDFQPIPERGCAPLTVAVADYSQDIRSWYWDFGDSTTGFGPKPRHTYQKPGRYRIQLIATSVAGACEASETNQERWVEVYERPQAGILWNREQQPIADGPPVRLRATTNDSQTNCHWDLGDGRWTSGCEVAVSWPDSGTKIVQLQVRNAAGCVDTASIRLLVAPAELSQLPTVFTPNGDGINDIWQPLAQTGQKLSVRIYDRNGREIYSGADGWNGRLPNGEEALPGTYTYLIHWNNRWYRGWVVLIR